MNQITPWSSPPGCAPCFDPAALLQCWCDIQATTDIISKIVLDQIQNNPAYAEAIVAAIAASGSSLPLAGVTNGAAAQPGQVGQLVELGGTFNYVPAGASGSITLGVLQPGDWDVWAFGNPSTAFNDISMDQSPVPAGFAIPMLAWQGQTSSITSALVLTETVQALISVPTLISFNVIVDANVPGTLSVTCLARRRR